jgi:hypothetical protein
MYPDLNLTFVFKSNPFMHTLLNLGLYIYGKMHGRIQNRDPEALNLYN